MLRCRLRFFQRLICLVIIVFAAAMLVAYRHHELRVIKSEFILTIMGKDKETNEIPVTGNNEDKKPLGAGPMVVYKTKATQSVASDKIKTLSVTSAWHVWRSWPRSTELYTDRQFNSSEMKEILHCMATAPIVRFDVGHKGTQLKALVELEGGQRVVFKPKRYDMTYQ